MEKIEIGKIELKIGDTVISLTLKEAKQLKEILQEAFPDKGMGTFWSYPVHIPTPKRRWDDWWVTWGQRSQDCTSSVLSISNSEQTGQYDG